MAHDIRVYDHLIYSMKATYTHAKKQHVSVFLLFVIFMEIISTARAQSSGPSLDNNRYSYGRFSPSLAVVVIVLIAAFFFAGFLAVYIRHRSDGSSSSIVHRALSLRTRRARGLHPSVIETFPTFSYADVKEHKIMGNGGGTTTPLECAVCLNEFEGDDKLRMLPACDHVFHPECIDAWLESHVTCPVCRANLSEPVHVPPHDDQSSNDDQHVIRVDEDRSSSSQRMFKFRSHSTGHSLMNHEHERFTLRLPAGVRKEVVDRAMLNRARSYSNSSNITSLPMEVSSKMGYRRTEPDRWAFLTRGLSMRSSKMAAEKGEVSTSKRRGSRTASFKCLEPKADDESETHLFSAGQSADQV